MDANGLDYL